MRFIKRAVVIIISMMLFTSGCSPFVENNTVEEIAPVTFLSFNKGEDGRIKMSTIVPPVTEVKKQLISFNVDLLKEGRREFNLKYYRELKLGQLRMIFINENLAKKDSVSIINTIISDPDVSPRLYIVIVKGNFEEYIKNKIKEEKNLDYNLYRMYRHYERRNQGEMTIVNLHEFMARYHSTYADPVLPVYRASKKGFSYEGTGLFKDDALKGLLKNTEDDIYQLLANDHYMRNLPIPSFSVSLGQVRSAVTKQINDSAVTLNLQLSARIEEYRGVQDLNDPREFMKLKNKIETYMEQETLHLLKKMQRMDVDPLEIGLETVRPFSAPPGKEEWKSQWRDMEIHAKCDVKLEPFSI